MSWAYLTAAGYLPEIPNISRPFNLFIYFSLLLYFLCYALGSAVGCSGAALGIEVGVAAGRTPKGHGMLVTLVTQSASFLWQSHGEPLNLPTPKAASAHREQSSHHLPAACVRLKVMFLDGHILLRNKIMGSSLHTEAIPVPKPWLGFISGEVRAPRLCRWSSPSPSPSPVPQE